MEETKEVKKGKKVGKVFATILAVILILTAVIGIVIFVYYQACGKNEEQQMRCHSYAKPTCFPNH